MDKLPNELVCMIGENLTGLELSRFSLASRAYWERLEPMLYRLHALREDRWTRSAVVKAVEFADPNKPETQAISLIVLDKVARFCRLDSAALDRCGSTFASPWLDSSRKCRLPFARNIQMQATRYPMSLLHIAVLKGLDDIVIWLFDQGASVDTPIPNSKTTALSLAVLQNHVATALLLLDNNADPNLRASDHNARDPPTVLHLACALGQAELAGRLLTGQYVEADPTELLDAYHLSCLSDSPGLVAALVRHGAEVSEDTFYAFLRASKLQSAWELLASPTLSDHLTAKGASSMLQAELSLGGMELANHVETATRMLRHLLQRGADPDLGRLLWHHSRDVRYPLILKLLPPFLEAGMDVRPALYTLRRARQWPSAEHRVDDLLSNTSAYDESQDNEGAAVQLAVVRLLLQHGAPIGGPTRGDALDSYPWESGTTVYGRVSWSYKLCRVILDHCHNTPEGERGEDIDTFMTRFADGPGRKRRTSARRNKEAH